MKKISRLASQDTYVGIIQDGCDGQETYSVVSMRYVHGSFSFIPPVALIQWSTPNLHPDAVLQAVNAQGIDAVAIHMEPKLNAGLESPGRKVLLNGRRRIWSLVRGFVVDVVSYLSEQSYVFYVNHKIRKEFDVERSCLFSLPCFVF